MSMMSFAFGFQEYRRETETHEDVDDKIYFAVGSDAEESWPNLSWVARNFAGWEIWFLHVLQPTRMIPSKHSPRGGEKQRIQKILKNYQVRLMNAGLKGGEEIYLKMEDIGEGVTKLISVLGIKNLVMEAAAREMVSKIFECIHSTVLSRTVATTESITSKSDVNMMSKILTRMVAQRAAEGESSQRSSATVTPRTKPPGSRTTQPSDTFMYMDLESVMTGTYTPELDVYSFGIVLLRLITGREAWGLKEEVQLALDSGNLQSLLDCSAGDWPYLHAQQLAQIALRCADVSKRNRPDLESEVLGVLLTMKASCGGSPKASGIRGDKHSQAPPPYYICPITQDVMQDPHVAADGYTYEKEGMQGWLNSHHTSPMTNLKLDHKNLIPNRALRSAIQEWNLHL